LVVHHAPELHKSGALVPDAAAFATVGRVWVD
jgi:hypothetical protein